MKQGVLIYYGEGYGKSTAALGSTIRSAVEGKTSTFILFLKGKNEEQEEFLSRLEPEVKLFCFAKTDRRFDELSEEEKQEEIQNLRNGFHYARKVITTGVSDVVVLDEILGLVDLAVIAFEELREVLLARPEDMTIILTGRVLDERIRALADETYEITQR